MKYRSFRILSTTRSIEGKIGDLLFGDLHPVRIMGVINLTDDSFYSGSVRRSLEDVKSEALRMHAQGADILDLGARSTAPYKKFDISVPEEEKTLVEAVKAVRETVTIPISADTTRFEPARAALEAGATMLNHVYGLMGPDSLKIARLLASMECALLLAAGENRPLEDRIETPIERVMRSIADSLRFCGDQGIQTDRIMIDPAIGFFKDEEFSNVEWNCEILANLERLRMFNLPICIGLSRKKFLGELIGGLPPEARLNASLAAGAISVYNGAHMIRTHDVKETRQAVDVARAIREKRFIQ